METQDLDRLFARARADAPEPSAALTARVLADAEALRPVRRAAAPHRFGTALRALWLSLSAGFGGGGVVASLGAVAVVAVFLGYSDPAGFGASLGEEFLASSDAAGDTGLEIVPVAEYFLSEG